MGPFSEKRQIERAEAVSRLLAHKDLSDWARNYWSGVLKNLAMSEDQYNQRVVQLYKDRTRSIEHGP